MTTIATRKPTPFEIARVRLVLQDVCRKWIAIPEDLADQIGRTDPAICDPGGHWRIGYVAAAGDAITFEILQRDIRFPSADDACAFCRTVMSITAERPVGYASDGRSDGPVRVSYADLLAIWEGSDAESTIGVCPRSGATYRVVPAPPGSDVKWCLDIDMDGGT